MRDATLRYVARWANPALAVTLRAARRRSDGVLAAPCMNAKLSSGAHGVLPVGFIYVLIRVSAHLAHH